MSKKYPLVDPKPGLGPELSVSISSTRSSEFDGGVNG
jgi:hypothetical protein